MMFFREIPPPPPVRVGILGIGELGREAVLCVLPHGPHLAKPGEMSYGHIEVVPGDEVKDQVTILKASPNGQVEAGRVSAPPTPTPQACPLAGFWEGINLAMIVFDHREPGAMAIALRACEAANIASAFTVAVCALSDSAWITHDQAGFQAMVGDFNRLGIAPILACADISPPVGFSCYHRALPIHASPLEVIPEMVLGHHGLVGIDLFDIQCTMDRLKGVTLIGVGQTAGSEKAAVIKAVDEALRQAGDLGLDFAASGLIVDTLIGVDVSQPLQIFGELTGLIDSKITVPGLVVCGLNPCAVVENGLQVTLFLCGVAGFIGEDAQAFNRNLLEQRERE